VAITRRGFLKVGGIGALALGGGAALTMRGGSARYAKLLPAGAEPRVLSTKELAVLAAFVDRVLPIENPSPREARIAERIDRELAFATPRVRRDVKNALFLVEHGGWARLSPTAFSARSSDGQDAYLRQFAAGRALERQAFSGLRTMAIFFYYCDERTWPAIHYEGPLVTVPAPPEADSALIKKLTRA
jgi:hypothetical protein